MAKIYNVLRYVDDIKPNRFTDDTKVQWLNDVEGYIQTEVMMLALADVVQYDPEAHMHTELLVKPPHDKLYALYLCAMIDFANGEYDKYANTMQLYNEFLGEYIGWYTLHFRPADGECVREGYYLSAYSIAVLHGFEGTEEEWLEKLKGAPGRSAYEDAVAHGYTGTEEEFGRDQASFAENATAVRQMREQAAADASSAAGSAENARQSANNASSDANAAANNAESAMAYAQSAYDSANLSAQYASGANSAKYTAETAATSAADSAAEAAAHKKSASDFATEARSSESNAAVSANDAKKSAEDAAKNVTDALTEAKNSGEFDGPPGKQGEPGNPGVFIGKESDMPAGTRVRVDPKGKRTKIPQIDDSLTQPGYAADASAVGEALRKKLSGDELPVAVNDALRLAKESGEFDGEPGKPGEPGVSPHIGANGNWFIGEMDTGVPARVDTDEFASKQELANLSKEIVNLNTTRINVRDFGAVGDGVTDDRQAIVDAFAAAKNQLPCEVYFPAGTYGISNGITVNMEYGTGGLLVRGAGRDVTTIKYLEDGYNPDVSGNSTLWYALRVWPVGMPNIKPTNETDYLHDISITDITVYDPDPIAHAWNTCKGDPSGEETHGFDLQYVNRAAVTNCNIITVGDEAIDLCGCIDAIISGNHIVGSPAAGSSGGAISIGDGCRGVVVSGNTVNGSCEDEVLEIEVTVAKGKKLSTRVILPDGTVYNKDTTMTADIVLPAGTILVKRNYGIAVESLYVPVSDVVIAENIVTDVRGNAINLGAPNSGAEITNTSVADNIIFGCSSGVKLSGTQPKSAIKISGNTISDCYDDSTEYGYGIYFESGVTDVTIMGNTIRNIGGDFALRLISGISKQMLCNNWLENIAKQIIYCSGDVIIKDCIFNGVGTAEHLGTKAAIIKAGGILTISGCKLSDIRSNCAVQGATVVENTEIEMVDASGIPNASGDVFKNIGGDANSLLRVVNCKVGARFIINRDNAIVQGVQIESTNIGTNAIIVNANGVLVTGCNIRIDKYSAIKEGNGYNGNIFTNNVTNRSIDTVGANSIAANNVDLRNLTTA